MEGSISGGRGGFDFIPVDFITKKTGASEAGVRFMLGLVVGIPFALGYHLVVPKSNSFSKHLYFTACGLLTSYFCFGADTIHSMISVLVTYVTLTVLGGGHLSLILMIAFHMGYLVIGYIVSASDSYDIKWTTPQCILCLRLMGLAWDLYDGSRREKELSADQKTTYIETPPGFLEICGYTYFYGSYLCGPQFPIRKYLQFVDNKLIDTDAEKKGPSRFTAAAKRLLLGTVFLILFISMDVYYRSDFPASKWFMEAKLWKQVIHLVLWNQVLFFKYIFVWLCAESSCILTGLGYNGNTESGNAKWDGVKNFSVFTYYFGYNFQSLVECFNINTNQWVSRYVFKRFRFLGNRELSHFLTLSFLAIWHGFYVGYFICFVLEFCIIMTERQICSFLYKVTGVALADIPLIPRVPLLIFLTFIKWYGMAFSVVAFALLRWRRINPIWMSHYYLVIIFLVAWQLFYRLLHFTSKFGKAKKSKDDSTKKDE